ncbi:dTDP-glucose 4,6-dehydratase [Veillonella agrestimuris]|uniref:dTDP-glucose 4,6-dehydratase n=1 Tax=Veillonella agrestimuris TaxID=2941340 RepID=UPI0020409DF8|nr:dTDP-glucose 4,6-dehydratase [Veillonella agrestimuris]
MKILITGGAGFIGSNFIYYLLKTHPSDEIICVDALTYAGNLHTLQPLLDKKSICFYKANITDREAIDRIVKNERPHIIVNVAAESHVDRSIENPGIFLETNVLGTQVLLDAARKYDVERYHQVSTDEVYGDLPLEKLALAFTENAPLRPSSPYAASKASADLLCLAYSRTYQMPITISRCSNNYGPYQFPEKLIPRMIINALHNKKLPVYGAGSNVRDWLYVEDHCAAIDLVMRKGTIGEIYNVGGHNEKTNLEVVSTILKALNKDESLIEFVADRPGHDLRYVIDSTKLETELGWTPKFSFAERIQYTIQWYVEYEEWWRNMLNGSDAV